MLEWISYNSCDVALESFNLVRHSLARLKPFVCIEIRCEVNHVANAHFSMIKLGMCYGSSQLGAICEIEGRFTESYVQSPNSPFFGQPSILTAPFFGLHPKMRFKQSTKVA
ncbi:hypothetical protein Slin_2151 [Spirosoma linguale DSM 74]|uniref:Uncharacterized protein n=1 Tax=Spirosoma linguale (strain ATCC 33905 / DSM 74 / LMG 10896 / Claus 1) TaxID=504472 RepID=D2QDP9_SPILD|nr:hypothetical protein Slin_2151 [Spirosoma linguale DSM 74]